MKNILTLLCCFSLVSLFAQKKYFQQEVNYNIAVTLDDETHTLTGFAEIEYHNKSTETLKEIYFHLWGNAYKNRETAFAEQKFRQGAGKFHFSEPETYGSFTEIEFQSESKELAFAYDKTHPDIALVTLNEPLFPGGKVMIKVPFTLDIPSSFSRLGHVEQSYQMTQWYPKPAVFDMNGWHQMPYLDQGEFYSEFGDFEVTIALPENYVVGASGTLQTESEQAFIEQKVKETEAYFADFDTDKKVSRSAQTEADSIPSSSKTMKTISYIAEDVHDFAWFADKRFKVQHDVVTLESGKKVDTYAMFSKVEEHLWKRGVEYVSRAVKFYSDNVGEYPWPQATAVQSALSAGGGMEYPMITVIGLSGSAQSLDGVITHEVGHNWFYGILASNERIHPWMDEGMNSYYDHRYNLQYYGDREMQMDDQMPAFIHNHSAYSLEKAGYLFQACRHRDQAPDTHSNDLSGVNYGLSAYSKPAASMHHLEEVVGTERFDEIMKKYYATWKFKHPSPQDFRAIWETEMGEDLNWFFDGLINSDGHIDYKITDVKEAGDNYDVTVKNVGDIAAPFPLNGMKDDTTLVSSQWFKGFEGTSTVTLPKGNYELIRLDGEMTTLEVDYRGNTVKTSGKKYQPMKLKFLAGVENPTHKNLFWLPTLGGNKYDGLMLGLGFHNYRIPERQFTFATSQMYGTKSGDWTDFIYAGYDFYPDNKLFQKITLAMDGQSFNEQYLENFDTNLKYDRLVPSIRFLFQHKERNSKYSALKYRTIVTRQEVANIQSIDSTLVLTGTEYSDYKPIHEISFEHVNNRAINGYGFGLTGEFGNRQVFLDEIPYAILKAEVKAKYTYQAKKHVSFRLFAAKGLSFETLDGPDDLKLEDRNVPGYIGLTGQGYSGYNDYKYDEWYFGRNAVEGLWSRQITMRDGGFKTALPSPYSTRGFNTNKLMVAVNLKADLPQAFPLNLPIKPYFDMAYIQPRGSAESAFSDNLWWSGGFGLEIMDGAFGVYFPVVNSQNIKSLYQEAYDDSDKMNYFRRVTFSLDLRRIKIKEMIERLPL